MPLRNTGVGALAGPARHGGRVAAARGLCPCDRAGQDEQRQQQAQNVFKSLHEVFSALCAEPLRESLVGDPADRQLNSKPRSARERAKNHVNQPVRRRPGMNGCSDPGWAARPRDNPTAALGSIAAPEGCRDEPNRRYSPFMAHHTRFLVAALLLLSSPAWAADRGRVTGDYVEARTAEVFAGGCIMNSEAETMGRQAVMAWRITHRHLPRRGAGTG